MRITLAILLVAVVSSAYSWNLPNLPSGKRSQYFVLHDDGGYKYGYDTGKSYFAKQAGDAHNEVAGHYVYKDITGKDVDVKYTAGIHGFVPEGLENLLPKTAGPHVPVQSYSYPAPQVSTYYSDSSSNDDQANTGDASYSFNIDTDSYKRQESSDASGNVQGKYSYTNEAGHHDLSYIAGSNTGFVATSGSLSVPNGVEGQASPAVYAAGNTAYSSYPGSHSAPSVDSAVNTDGSYSFDYSTNDQSRHESSDASGNVQGRYSFTNEAGTHDLSYVAGSATGFQPTGGSLALPNGLAGKSTPYSASGFTYPPPVVGYAAGKTADYTPSVPNTDGSYSFAYSTGDSSRQENSDASGNVQGRYTYTNNAGTHDLSYVAGAQTGFLPTGGSLASPNGLEGNIVPSTYSASGQYVPTTYSSDSADSTDDQSDSGDSSYSFTVDTDEYKRTESSDAQGNVKGSFSYKNAAGQHGLSFVAGKETGFLPTGGSLSLPNGLEGKEAPSPSVYSAPVGGYAAPTSYSSDSQDNQANTGDASYSFVVDTPEYQRQESSDAQGNVKGSFSYSNVAGSHDLSYVAGSSTGFVATGGSLSMPNGVAGSHVSLPVAEVKYLPPQARANVHHFEGQVGNVVVKTYLPPESHSKYGYIYESS